MAEVNPVHVYTDNLKVLEKIMGVMFNNIKFSDTVFTVKEQKFYALSQLLAASSTTLDSLISIHYENCHDKEIKLHNVKNEESFSVILQYMYGMKINFSEINVSVLCEVLTLSETYKLDDFFKDLKQYLSNINKFQLESCIVLLNTADKYNVPELREQLIIFVYKNVDQLVKHVSFKNLQYNILVDLLKTNWFCCSEIKILTGVLNWHSDMDDESKKQMTHKKELVNDNADIELQDVSNDVLDASECEKDVDEIKEAETHVDNEMDVNMGDDVKIKDFTANKEQNQSTIVVKVSESKTDTSETKNIQSNVESVCSKSENVVVVDGDTISNIKDNTNAANSKQADGCAKIMQSFSENILKSLLAQIRISRISALEFSLAMKTELFKKYSWIIGNVNSFSQSSEPRQTYYKIKEINDVAKRFTIKGELSEDIMYGSEEESIGDFKWKLYMRMDQDPEFEDWYSFTMFLKVDSIKAHQWECNVEWKLRWFSNGSLPSMSLPHEYFYIAPNCKYGSLDFTSDQCEKTSNYICLGQWDVKKCDFDSEEWKDQFEPDHIRTFKLKFKSLKYKVRP